mmetsp:Transcript_39863/g.43196  ORF Transcript_39863/g.43196 Transcript_39863/m.43196 type:complete len:84 (-) Transcript_39863:633-884(-)
MTSLATRLSNPLVGSSKNRTGGRVINANPILTRLHCPPEIPRAKGLPMTVERHESKFNIWITSLTRPSRSSAVKFVGNFRSAV